MFVASKCVENELGGRELEKSVLEIDSGDDCSSF